MTPLAPTISPCEFIDMWEGKDFGERQASQQMFLDVCGLVGHPTPVQLGDRAVFTFEKLELSSSGRSHSCLSLILCASVSTP